MKNFLYTKLSNEIFDFTENFVFQNYLSLKSIQKYFNLRLSLRINFGFTKKLRIYRIFIRIEEICI